MNDGDEVEDAEAAGRAGTGIGVRVGRFGFRAVGGDRKYRVSRGGGQDDL